MNLEEKIKYIETKKGINHDLMEFRSWLNEAMPEHKQLKKIQVGGTNGKGSTVAWMNQLLTKSGYKVGAFTSPHLVTHFERIRIGNTYISAADWQRIYDQYADFFEAKAFTMFEIDLWMAIAYFLEQKVDIALIEVGLGGRMDATTALDYQLLLITNVGLEHTEFLGDTIEQITFEKSGIFKPGVIALTTETKPNAQKVMEQVAGYMQTMLGFVSMPYKEVYGNIEFVWLDHTYTMHPPKYQLSNLALALEGLHQLGYSFEPELVQDVLDHFAWEGRFVCLRKEPLILLDGAHNLEGIQALAQSIPTWSGDIFFSVLKDKRAKEMLEVLSQYNCPIYLVHMDSSRAYDLDTLGYPVLSQAEMLERLKAKKQAALLCGSLYFVGDFLKEIKEL